MLQQVGRVIRCCRSDESDEILIAQVWKVPTVRYKYYTISFNK
jgi:hypothetical protein